MATLFSDSFDRANAANLGANWDADDSGVPTDWDIDTNTAESQVQNGNTMRTVSGAHADTADTKVTVTQVSASGDGGPLSRCTAKVPIQTNYVLFIASNVATLYRANAGVDTQLGSGVGITQVANGVAAIEVSGTGTTVTVKSYYQGSLLDTQSDTDALRLTTAGRTGMTSWSTGAGTAARYNDFLVEDLAAGGGPVIPVFMNQYRQRRN